MKRRAFFAVATAAIFAPLSGLGSVPVRPRSCTILHLGVDEASGISLPSYHMISVHCKRVLVFGSPWPRRDFFMRRARG